MLHPALPAQLLPLGTLPGAAQVQLVTPDVPVAVEGFTLQLQAAYLDGSLVRTSVGQAAVLLDGAF